MRSVTAAAFAVTLFVLLTGCTQPEPIVTPPAEPTSEPVFASDEEALAAAEEAYALYNEMSNQVTVEGANPQRLAEVVTDEQLERELGALEEILESGRTADGSATFDSLTLQQWTVENGTANVIIYLCLDISATRVYDSSGADITAVDRRTRIPFEAEFESKPSDPTRLLLARHEVWSGKNFC